MSATLFPPPVQLAALFDQLVRQWRAETQFLSSTTQLATHPAYQRIIGLGPQVIPFILADLRQRPGHWSWALKALSGENPVPPEAQGRLAATADAWLEWGREAGWIA